MRERWVEVFVACKPNSRHIPGHVVLFSLSGIYPLLTLTFLLSLPQRHLNTSSTPTPVFERKLPDLALNLLPLDDMYHTSYEYLEQLW